MRGVLSLCVLRVVADGPTYADEVGGALELPASRRWPAALGARDVVVTVVMGPGGSVLADGPWSLGGGGAGGRRVPHAVRAAPTTSRASCWTWARCSRPRKDSA